MSAIETVTLTQARHMIEALAHEHSILLLAAPGVGKSHMVADAAANAGLECRSLLGTQIAPEDVSGIPKLVGERSVFCPPRVLLPESSKPFCLFLDELPACSPDVQKAMYSLLLERRVGEHALPRGSWVVAAGNRVEDRALVRSLSSALVNRVFILNVEIDPNEWLRWAGANGVRSELLSFLSFMPEALVRSAPATPAPFSTPRAWTSLSQAWDLCEARGIMSISTRRALAMGRVSAPDAALLCAMLDMELLGKILPIEEYLRSPGKLPEDDATRWFIFSRIREQLSQGVLFEGLMAEQVNRFLGSLPQEHRFALFIDLTWAWGRMGANASMLQALEEVVGWN